MGEDSLRDAIAGSRTQRLINSKAKSVVAKWGGTRTDTEDLAQFINLFLVRLVPTYTAERAGVGTFIDRGIDWGIRAYLREQRRDKRGRGRRLRSLDTPVRPGFLAGGDRLQGTLEAASAKTVWLDKFHRVLAGAAPGDAAVARALMLTGSVLGASRELGVSRRQVEKAMERLRELFDRSDLEGI